jgi:hypothetical protein
MGIINPEDHLSRADKELLILLGGLLVGTKQEKGKNYRQDDVPLSDSEARRLIELLDELISSKKFIESAYFVEEITKGSDADDRRLREIFSYWRSRTGRAKSMTWLHWNEFLRRFSASNRIQHYSRPPISNEMTFEYFFRMERLLLSKTPLSPKISSLVLKTIKKFEMDIEAARNGSQPLPTGSIMAQPRALLESLILQQQSALGLAPFSSQRAIGIVTLVADLSVLHTTRDWGVAGTLSTMAGALAAANAE